MTINGLSFHQLFVSSFMLVMLSVFFCVERQMYLFVYMTESMPFTKRFLS